MATTGSQPIEQPAPSVGVTRWEILAGTGHCEKFTQSYRRCIVIRDGNALLSRVGHTEQCIPLEY